MNLGKSSNYFFYRGFISIILNSNRFIRQICFNFFYTLLKTNIVLNLALTVGTGSVFKTTILMSFAKQVAVKQTAAIIAINFVLIIHFYLIINILVSIPIKAKTYIIHRSVYRSPNHG